MDLMSRVARRSSDHSDQYRVFVVSFYTMDSHQSPFSAAPFIREIARGKKGARDLSREDARMLFTAMLNSEVSDLELGGFLIGMRIKGESVAEIAGFLDAVESSFDALPMPEAEFAPVVIPS